MASSAIGKLWERHVLSHALDLGMRGVDPVRRELLERVEGRVLEIGFGTGASLTHYRSGVEELIAVEPASELAAMGRERLARWSSERGVRGSLLEASATRPLPVDAGSIDAVVILFVLCSVERIDALLEQAHRVLRPGAAIHLAEHVAANADPQHHRLRDRAQRVIRPAWKLALGGCDPHKSIDGALARNGFATNELSRRELDLPWVVRSGLVGRARRV